MLFSYDKTAKFLNSEFYMLTILRGLEAQVFYDTDYLCKHWGRTLTVLSVTPEAYGYQTAILLEK